MAFVSEIEAVTAASFFQRSSVVDEKFSIVNVVFLSQLAEEPFCESVRSRRFKLCVE